MRQVRESVDVHQAVKRPQVPIVQMPLLARHVLRPGFNDTKPTLSPNEILGDVAVANAVGRSQKQDAVFSEDALYLADERSEVGQMLDNLGGENAIEKRRIERETLRAGIGHDVMAALVAGFDGLVYSLGIAINAPHGKPQLRKTAGLRAGAATIVQHTAARNEAAEQAQFLGNVGRGFKREYHGQTGRESVPQSQRGFAR